MVRTGTLDGNGTKLKLFRHYEGVNGCAAHPLSIAQFISSSSSSSSSASSLFALLMVSCV